MEDKWEAITENNTVPPQAEQRRFKTSTTILLYLRHTVKMRGFSQQRGRQNPYALFRFTLFSR
ncbi:hypothetical protein HNR48_003526 [Pseudoteredinibacter isoporae]|uniref:Uncharacterized protein n=1 Tax=Pseudoteredinibacter isoporae TaxID=570281 RepID=A0A7X0JVV9_9GAMM|nr:hypothetical protein [Pseudoteredinibacter isoporae]